ncbi:hypothetical protein [Actinomadura oligospora]|uniref:hypothetical protein n=1 Tax=Actinomadura oligospora TaxID=111804 RepID=UPI00047A9F1C|nr:hypothetical protein [Actinomadura oligospora]
MPSTDARAIGDTLVSRGVRLSVGGTIHDPADPMGEMFFNLLATLAKFEADLMESFSVGRATVYRVLERAQTATPETTS